MSCLSFPATSTTAISTLSLHDALPISTGRRKHCHRHYDRDHVRGSGGDRRIPERVHRDLYDVDRRGRSEEHTSELQSRGRLVCRLLLEKKNCNWIPFRRNSLIITTILT